jgi:hypothetical protein
MASPSQVSTSSSPLQKSSDMSSPDLMNCSAAELADGLLERFGGLTAEALAFLQSCREILQSKASGSSTTVDTTSDTVDDLGETLLSEPIVPSMLVPRGKVSISFFGGNIRATDVKTATEAWRLTSAQVTQVVVFPKPEDCKKPMAKKSADVVMLHLAEPLTIRTQKKPVTQISFVLPTDLPSWRNAPDGSSIEDPTVAWMQVLHQALGNPKLVRVQHPSAAAPSAFRSYQADRVSTTNGGMPFVTCYQGTKDGVLYPLTDGGLLFYKPPLLVPSHEVEGITTGARGGGGSSRYVDLLVQCTGEDHLEFSNLNREEMEGLQRFLTLAAAEDDAMVDEDKEEETEEATGSRQRSKRKASVEARRINKRMIVSTEPSAEEEDEQDADYTGHVAVEDDDVSDNEDPDDEDDEDSNDGDHDEELGAGGDDDDEEEDESVNVDAAQVLDDDEETDSDGD